MQMSLTGLVARKFFEVIEVYGDFSNYWKKNTESPSIRGE